MTKKVALTLTLSSFLLGYFLGTLLKTSAVKVESEVVTCENETFIESKTKIPEVSCHKELNEAKELYGKAFTMFLANLGFKVAYQQKKRIDDIIDDPQAYLSSLTPNEEITPVIKEKNTKSNFKRVYSNEDVMNYIKNNRDFTNGPEDTHKIKAGMGLAFKDPALSFARSKYIDSFKKIRFLNGLYTGRVFFFDSDKKGEIHDLEMRVDFYHKDNEEGKNKIDGNFQLKLSSNGEVYSNSKGSGGNGDVRLINDDIIIEAGPKRFLSFRKKDMSIANYYDDNKHVGFVKLNEIK